MAVQCFPRWCKGHGLIIFDGQFCTEKIFQCLDLYAYGGLCDTEYTSGFGNAFVFYREVECSELMEINM